MAVPRASGSERQGFRSAVGLLAAAAVVAVVLVSPSPPPEQAVSLDLVPGDCVTGVRGCVRWRLVAHGDAAFLGPTTFGEYGYVGVDADAWSGVYAFDLQTGREVWATATEGRIRAAPAVWGGVVVAVSDGTGKGVVQGLDALHGDQRWRTEIEGEPAGSPTIVDGVVFVPVAEGATRLDALSGEEIEGLVTAESLTGPPVAHQGTVYFGHGRGIAAARADDLELGWTAEAGHPVLGPKVVRIGVSGILVAAHADGTLAAYSGRSGDRLWQRTDLAIPALPPLVDSWVVVGMRNGRFYLLDPWSGRAPAGHRPGADASPIERPDAWVLAGRIAYVVHDGEIGAYNVRTGGPPLWTHRLDRGVTGQASAPIVSVDSVLLATPDGLIALRR